MEITTYQIARQETHVLGGQNTVLTIKCEIVDTIEYYPTTGDKEFPSDSCDWQNPDDEDDWELYRILKNEYHEKYGPLTLKQYVARMHLIMGMFRSAEKLRTTKRRYIARIWALKLVYDLADNSIPLLCTRMKKGIISLYERAVKFKYSLPEMNVYDGVQKYTEMTSKVMDSVCEKINVFFTENPVLLASLSCEAKVYFFQTAPGMISTIRYLHEKRWIDEDLIPHTVPKYYEHWKKFWTKYIIRSFCTKQICLGEDVCEKIAEYMPERISGSSFVDFFQKHFDVVNQCYIGSKQFGIICNEQRSEITIILQ